MPIQIPLIRKTKYERYAPVFRKRIEEGATVTELAAETEISEALVNRILTFGETGVRPDWHQHCLHPWKGSTPDAKQPKYVRYSKFVAEQHNAHNVPLSHIPKIIFDTFGETVSEATVTAAYKYAQTIAKNSGDLLEHP